MRIFKSHFWYTKSQRNGIFLLITLIIIIQVLIFFSKEDNKTVDLNTPEIKAFQKQIDSLKKIELERRKPKIFPFNPNFISDYKGSQLGLSLQEIDRLHAFREKGKFINSKQEFQKVTKVSDSLLSVISPFFKFPDWVVKRNEKLSAKSIVQNSTEEKENDNLTTTDLNRVSVVQLTSVPGISEKIASRIVSYRSKLNGFYFEDQLYEVFNISENQVQSILSKFKIQSKPTIIKQNINTIEFKQLLKLPYIDYDLCKRIFDYRDQVAELQNINELKNVENFPLNKYDRIILYLKAE